MPMTTTNAIGAIMVKAAWRVKTARDDASRYYTLTAYTNSPETGWYRPATVLLVGSTLPIRLIRF